MKQAAVLCTKNIILTYLFRFEPSVVLFPGDDVFKSVDVLSGGERSRLILLRLLLHPHNLLVLDEPTNHLDMSTKDVLLQGLKAFSGSMLFVSHDRFFINGLATAVLELDGGRGFAYPGGYDYFLRKREDVRAGETEAPSKVNLREADGGGHEAFAIARIRVSVERFRTPIF